MPSPVFDPRDIGKRPDGTQKGNGYFGVLARPDGGVSSELSMGTSDVDGAEQDVPMMVPSLSPEELKYLLLMQGAPDWADPTMRAIADKAVEFAKSRKAAGLPAFAGPDEQTGQYPELTRAVPKGADALATSRRGANPSALATFLLQQK